MFGWSQEDIMSQSPMTSARARPEYTFVPPRPAKPRPSPRLPVAKIFLFMQYKLVYQMVGSEQRNSENAEVDGDLVLFLNVQGAGEPLGIFLFSYIYIYIYK